MLVEFLISKTDGRCLYYLSEEYHHDPQLISGYLASLIMFMKSHQSNVPKTIVLEKGQWIFEYDPAEVFFIAASIEANNVLDEEIVRNTLSEILTAVIIITGNNTIPLESNHESIQKILDDTIKMKLLPILTKQNALKFQPGILQSYIVY